MNEVRDLWPSIKVLLLYTLIQDPSFKDVPN